MSSQGRGSWPFPGRLGEMAGGALLSEGETTSAPRIDLGWVSFSSLHIANLPPWRYLGAASGSRGPAGCQQQADPQRPGPDPAAPLSTRGSRVLLCE